MILLVGGLAVWFPAVPAVGQSSPESAEKPTAAPTPAAIFERAGLTPVDECIEFREWKRLRVRRKRWQEAIRMLARRRPEVLYGWLIGSRQPPDRAVDEARRQRNCLLEALVRDALANWSELRLDIDAGAAPDRGGQRLHTWLESSLESPAGRRRLRRAMTVSHHRTALSQAQIWRRKFLFVGSSFNEISASAADDCDLRTGAPWDPGRARHAYCWEQVLSPADREREILSASSAPGLSRHHWGTEFDFFGLAPREFAAGAPYHDEYEWLDDHARGFGFFQPYRDHTATYMEERWHWSYYPVAQALTKFASNHRQKVDAHLQDLWDRLEARFNRGSDDPRQFFGHIREHWKPYVFDVFAPNFERGRR